MHIVIFTHPGFMNSQSMPKYAGMLVKGMKERKHTVETWTAKEFFLRIPSPRFIKKWFGYLDQFLIFPLVVQRKLSKESSETLFVLADQALGMWAPLVAARAHVTHCHDFLAQRSALGEIPEKEVSFTGKIYQKLIRNGYRNCDNFISISKKTQSDLHRFLNTSPRLSEVVYNGLNQDFKPGNVQSERELLSNEFKIDLTTGYILHIGGNQFYKNRKGVIKIYEAWRKLSKKKFPLLMIGPKPPKELIQLKKDSAYSNDIQMISNVSDFSLRAAYHGALVLLYPSLEEGFGWPIAEAMASGCPVITTARAPMNEVAGESCYYIPRMPINEIAAEKWGKFAAGVLNRLVELPPEEREQLIKSGLENAKRFNTKKALEEIESIYSKILKMHQL